VLQSYFPFLPEGAKPINNHVAIYRHDGEIVFYTSSGPIYSCRQDDHYGFRLAQAIVVTQTATTAPEMARALDINKTTVYRNVERYQKDGPSGLIIKRPHAPHKLDRSKIRRAQSLLDRGYSLRAVGRKTGVTEGCIRYAIKKGRLERGEKEGLEKLKSPSQRSVEDSRCKSGIGVKREEERVLASKGKIFEAAPEFTANEAVRYAGVLMALPVLAQVGLLEAGRKAYGALQNGFYGLRSVLLTLAFMALLRFKTPEQFKRSNPGELGIILGLDRAPEVKTLRRKLREMGLRDKAGDFLTFLSRKWTAADKDVIGFAYIDGHVRAYHGRKHKLPKTHVARRRLCMPATTDFWVNDADCEPLFFVTAEANDGLLSMLEKEIIPELKELCAGRVTLVFDREGWSPKSFQKWFKAGIDVITYRKGSYDPWPAYCFIEVESQVCGKAVTYLLAERSVQINGHWFREVRRLCDSGHQTSIITTRQDLDFEQVARRMFFRWNQENFFRYMREEYALDHMVTNTVEPADVERLVPNPAKKEKSNQLKKLRRHLEKLKSDYGEKALQNSGDLACVKTQIGELENQIEQSRVEMRAIAAKTAVKHLLSRHEIVRLETERKKLTDGIKMICYRTETSMLNLVAPFFTRSTEEGRAFLKSVFQQPADIIPDTKEKKLLIRFHTMPTPRENHALQRLCEIITEVSYVYPGTDLKMVFSTQ